LWVIFQEFHIRQMDGQVLSPDAEEQVKKCLEAAIERRSSKVQSLRILCETVTWNEEFLLHPM
jgi:hypothetical protein